MNALDLVYAWVAVAALWWAGLACRAAARAHRDAARASGSAALAWDALSTVHAMAVVAERAGFRLTRENIGDVVTAAVQADLVNREGEKPPAPVSSDTNATTATDDASGQPVRL